MPSKIYHNQQDKAQRNLGFFGPNYFEIIDIKMLLC